jgi:hypothetical protein
MNNYKISGGNGMKLAHSIVLVVMALVIFSGTAFSQKLNPGTKAAMKLLEMKAKGWIDLSDDGHNTLIMVEPKVWNVMTHKQKYQMTKWGIDYTKEANKTDGSSLVHVFLYDMTSRKELARGIVMGDRANRIDIYK